MYKNRKKEELILRDELAIDRTLLANERTLLAYVRTAITSAIAAGSVLKFFPELYMQVIGWSGFVLTALILYVGFIKHRRMNKLLKREIPSVYNP